MYSYNVYEHNLIVPVMQMIVHWRHCMQVYHGLSVHRNDIYRNEDFRIVLRYEKVE